MYPFSTSSLVDSNHAQLLEQLSDEEFWKQAAEAATPLSHTHTLYNVYLVCAFHHGHCIFPLTLLREIVPPPYHFSRFPATPSWLCGLSAWHGEAIAVIDLDAYLLPHASSVIRGPGEHLDGLLLIAQHEDSTLGFFVSAVESTVCLEAEQILSFEQVSGEYPPNVIAGIKRETGGQESFSFLLDIPAIFNDITYNIKMTTSNERKKSTSF